MSTLKFKLEVILTIVCLFLIYSYASKQQSAGAAGHSAMIDQAVVTMAERSDMETRAKSKAQQMIATGDISEYKEQVENNKTLMKIMGY